MAINHYYVLGPISNYNLGGYSARDLWARGRRDGHGSLLPQQPAYSVSGLSIVDSQLLLALAL